MILGNEKIVQVESSTDLHRVISNFTVNMLEVELCFRGAFNS